MTLNEWNPASSTLLYHLAMDRRAAVSYTHLNVGKSTLMNVLVGERISIATFKAQTTRHRIMGIYNTDDMQIVFSDVYKRQ